MEAGNFLRHARPGDNLYEHLTTHSYNSFVDVANYHKANQFPQRGELLDYEPNPFLITFRNDSGAARSRYDILSPTGIVFTPTAALESFQTEPLHICTTPTLANSGKFAILLDAVGTSSSDKYGRAAVVGVWVVKLLVNHVQHQYADVAANSARLTSNWYGAAKILYKESGTGEKWAQVIMLGDQFRGPIEGKIADAAGLAYPNTGPVNVWFGGGGASPTDTIQGQFQWMATGGTLIQGAPVLCWWVPDQQKYKIYNSVCPVF